ncbi:RT0821/Lpp0805 family surface protein [Geopsychrobacter electrodiphilus]|uniref:RT0821/Lpp0805 family surface protein n=1 Tax=Geopsychrobacter electrodiphilus TaxID=225196 RepID=UPI00037EB7B5|nr:RT0821/Lpp0805 family surface protein [Geopsychrobacter electrodiphilus]
MRWITGLLTIFFTLTTGAGLVFAQGEQQLNGVEVQAMADTFQYALENNPTSKASDWANPDAERSGAVVPTRTFENTQGQPCREFVTKITIGGQEEQGYGTACRQPDGHWQLLDENGATAGVPSPPPPRSTTYFVEPPPVYYGYPSGFYGPSSIYLSFGYVYRSGKIYHGSRYLDGHSFRQRYPSRVRNQIYIGPKIFTRYRLRDELNYREWDRDRAPRRIKHKKWQKERYEDREGRHEGRRNNRRGSD